MDLRYEAFCIADPVFYDSPAIPMPEGGDYAESRPVPEGWGRRPQGVWMMQFRLDGTLPDQGWKVHVAAGLDNAEEVLDAVIDYCTRHRVAFKFLRSRRVLMARNSKYAERGGSGKFITIYPRDENALERVLRELGSALDGQPGPYILSDLRWRSGPLYVRYGGFRERLCQDESGVMVPGIEDPEGRLVPDLRDPTFRVPDWVVVPEFLAEALAARDSEGPDDFVYRIEEALHFSNGGGLYRAVDPRTDRKVLIKEARPLAGLDRGGSDAVTRLRRECGFLERLGGLDCVPEMIEYRTWWEHHFAVREYVEGETLTNEMVRRNPLLRPGITAEAVADYTAWALAVVERVERGLAALHERGVVFGDLHPSNIIVRPDGSIAFVDFEVAAPVEEAVWPTLGAAGYRAPGHYTGFAIDRYALGCIRLAIFMSLTAVLPWDDSKIDQFIGIVTSRFPVPAGYADQVRRDLGRSPRPGGEGAPVWPVAVLPGRTRMRDSISRAITSSATPERSDRLFPGDIEQFGPGGGLGFAYGAAGVLWALAETGAGRFPGHETWLIEAVRAAERPRPGFYDGLGGIAYVLDRLGRSAEAREILDRAPSVPDATDDSLFRGLAGIGLNHLNFHRRTAESAFLRAAEEVADRLMARLRRPPAPGYQAGLMYGSAGPALFLVRLYEATGQETLLDHAGAALRRELDACEWTQDGTLQVDEGWRLIPYLATGSTGIGLVLHEYLRHRPDADFEKAQQGIAKAAEPEFVVQAGLFNGRAGLLAYLLHTAGDRATIEQHVRNLGWHAVSHQGGVAFIGDQLMRLSMDLATGSAGVLLTLGAALGERGPGLPFLKPWRGDGDERQPKEVNGHGEDS
jgi:serine/threonine protein kinase